MNYREAEGFYGARGIRGPIYSRRKLERETAPFIYYGRLFILEGKKINWPFLRNRIVKFKKNYPRTGEKTTQYGMVESWRDN